jgi:threonine/homoserine/homoserine lactone efflux protein
MGAAVGAVLPFAVGIAVSPIPIIAIIVILFSQRARINGPVFLLGWVVGLTTLSIAVYALASAAISGTDDAADGSPTWWRVVLGVLLIVLAVRKFRGANDGDEPKWMRGVDHISPGRAFVLAALLSSVNPKNLVLTIGGITALVGLDLAGTEAAVGIGAFVLIASSTIGVSVGYYLVGGAGARHNLERLRAWMDTHNNAVMGALMLIIGVVLISKGLGG